MLVFGDYFSGLVVSVGTGGDVNNIKRGRERGKKSKQQGLGLRLELKEAATWGRLESGWH